MMFQPVLELTHNHGTESRPEFKSLSPSSLFSFLLLTGLTDITMGMMMMLDREEGLVTLASWVSPPPPFFFLFPPFGYAHCDEVDDLNASCEWLESEGVTFRKRPQDGNMKSKESL
jgi:hypothetical protein